MYTVRIFMKCTHVCAAQTTYFKILHQITMEPDFPCLADEIAEPHPGMNIKVAPFTESEKSIDTSCLQDICHGQMGGLKDWHTI